MADAPKPETCSGKVDCTKKIIELFKKNPDCAHKADTIKELKMYIKDPNISPVAYKRLLCFSQSFCDGRWTRKCGEISQFKKSKKRSKSPRKPYRKTSRKSPSKSLRKKL